MKLKAALIVVAVMLLGLAAWSQEFPKAEIAIDYSYMHFQAIDYKTLNYDFGQAFILTGGGGSLVYNFTRMFGFKVDLQGYGSDTRSVVVPPGNPFLPGGGAASVNGDLFTYMFGVQAGKRYGVFRPYADALVGGAHSNVYGNVYRFENFTQFGKSPSSNALAANVGVGLDFAVGQHVAIRPLEVSYLYTNFSNKLAHNQNSFRYLGGVVVNVGGKPPVPPTETCTATPASVMAGEPVTVTAAGHNFNPKHTLTYAWTTTGGKLSSSDTQTSRVDTAGLTGGTYTANATITDPKGPKDHNVASCGANFNVNVPHNPPQVTCSAGPNTVKSGESSTIKANATSPDNAEITGYSYTASAGTVSGSGTSATLDTSNQPAGTINVTATATDSRGLTGTCTTSVGVIGPTVSCVNIEDWGECTFEKNPKKPWRVDNDCKDTLDKLSLRMQQMPNGKLEIVGYTDEKESVNMQQLGARRSVNVKYYLTTDGPNKVDASRIQPRQGGTKGQATHFYFVPEGNLCSGQVEEGTAVDETAVQPQSRNAPAPKKAKKAAAAPSGN
jgi:hypothetical protein